jgi:hypothetical protein
MPWPKLEDNIRVIDMSREQNWRNNMLDRESGRVDFPELASLHPEIKVVISRIAGGWSGPDPDFQYNHDESEEAGFHTAGYVNANPGKSVSSLLDWWKPAIGDRDVRLLVVAAELTGGQPKEKITAHVRDCHKAVKDTWPEALVIIQYTAAWWWNPNIVHGWEDELIAWVAHYPFFKQSPINGEWIQAEGFGDVDDLLPIDNNFTPRVPQGMTIDKIGMWQLSEKGIIVPITQMPRGTPRVDLNYMKRWLFNMAYDIPEPPPPPPPDTARFMRDSAKELRVMAADMEAKADEI